MVSQLGELVKMRMVQGDGVTYRLVDCRGKGKRAAARAGAGTHFDQAQGAGDFQLLTEARHANTQLAAQLIERGQAAFCFRVRSQVAEELGKVSRGAFS